MTACQISRDEAKAFFVHKSQRDGFSVEEIPQEGAVEYWASGPLCGVFAFGLWYDTWNFHIGVKPDGWGSLVDPGKDVLSTFWDAKGAKLITAWIAQSNRPAIAYAKRLGFFDCGSMPHPDGEVIMQGWKKCQ